MGRRERIDPTAEAAAFIAANSEVAKELGLVSAEQVVADAIKGVNEATRIAATGEGHNGDQGQPQEL